MKLHNRIERLEVTEVDLAGSSFANSNLSGATFRDVSLADAVIDNVTMTRSKWHNVNLSGLSITDADLSHASILESCTEGMTIDGVAVSEMMAAYRKARNVTP